MFLIALVLPHYAYAFTTGQAANLVIGQTDFTSGGSSTTSTSLFHPLDAAFDSSGNLWVVDRENSRVLRYSPPFSTGQASDLVIGQTDFTSGGSSTTSTSLFAPFGVAFDSSGNLWVADHENSRVLRYSPPFTTGQAANLVIGQSDFVTGTGNTGGLSSTTLWRPDFMAFDSSGNLWVVDHENRRVLRYSPPFATGQASDLVIGQTSFTSGASGTTSTTLFGPAVVAFDPSGNLWVVDTGNHRVLRYSPPFATGQASDLVIGQTDFTSGGSGTTSTTLKVPGDMAFDPSGNLWVSDQGNNRVLRYSPPFSTGQASDLVIGQTDFTSGGSGTTSTALFNPTDVVFDSSGNLWVADALNNRVLRYSTVIGSTTTVTPNPSSVIIGNTITYTVTVTGSGPTPTGTVTWSAASGSFSGGGSCTLSSGSCTITYTPPADSGPVTITATYGGDSKYAASSGTSSLTVLTPAQAVQNLINVKDGMNLPNGLTHSLNAKLQAALDSINRGQNTAAKNQLTAFIDEVNAKCCENPPSKPLTTAQANQLIAAANDIISALP